MHDRPGALHCTHLPAWNSLLVTVVTAQKKGLTHTSHASQPARMFTRV